MSQEKFQEAKGLLAHSQQLRDVLMQQEMAQQSPEMEQPIQPTDAPQTLQDAPAQAVAPQAAETPIELETSKEDKAEPKEESKDSKTADKLLGVIGDMVEADRLEEERRIKELETEHESDLKTITDRVKALFKRGKKK